MNNQRNMLRFFIGFLVLAGMLGLHSCSRTPSGEEDATDASDAYLDSIYRSGMRNLYTEPDSVIKVADQLYDIASREDNVSWMIRALNMYGALWVVESKYAMALEYYYQALNLAIEHDDKDNIARLYYNIGYVSQQVGDYKEALDFFIKTINHYERTGDEGRRAKTMVNIGFVYLQVNNHSLAQDYFYQAYEVLADSADAYGLISCYNGLGRSYYETGDLNKALDFFNQSAEISKSINERFFLSSVYQYMGDVYLEREAFDVAEQYYVRSDSLASAMQIAYQRGIIHLSMARLKIKQKHYDQALLYAYQAEQIGNDIDNNVIRMEVYKTLSQIYELQGNPARALAYFQQSNQIEKALLNQENLHQIYNLEIRELSNEKEIQRLEIEQQQLLLNKSRSRLTIIILLSVSVIFMLVLIYYVYLTRIRNIQKQELNEAKLSGMEKQAQITLKAEMAERQRLGMELHDGVGPLLSLVRLNLQMLLDKPEIQSERKEVILNNTVGTVDETLKEMKNISRNMVPLVLLEQGLESGVRDLVKRMNNLDQYKINVNFSGKDWLMEPYMAHTIYRAIQEVLNNCIMHSQCREITLQAIKSEDEITIMVEDDGIGFDPENIKENKGLGLQGTLTRIKNLKGELLIDSVPQRGTIVTILVPIRNQA